MTQTFMRQRQAGVHPKLFRALDDVEFFPLHCTIEVRDEVRTAMGGMASPDNWTAVEGYKDIPCRFVNRHGVEPRYLWGQAENEPILIALNGLYESIDGSKMRARIDDPKGFRADRIFNITSVAGDSTGTYTILVARDYKPSTDEGL